MSWMDAEPVRGAYPDPRMLGLPGIRRMNDLGLVPRPPIHYLFGLAPVETIVGMSTFSMPASPRLLTPAGMFLGGVSALVADAPLGSAILSKVGPGIIGVTSELSVNFLRPADPSTGTLYSHAQAIDVGRSVGLSQATVEDPEGTLLAHATSRYFLRKLEPIPDPSALEPVSAPAYDTPDPYARPAPPIDATPWADMTGLEAFRAAVDGTLPRPPFAELFDISTTEADEGSIVQRMPAREWLCSPARTVYGGVLAFFADAAMTAAVATTLPARSSCATLDLKLHFLRPGIADGRDLFARGRILHRGRTFAVTTVEIVNADGKQLVVGSGSTMVLEGRPWQRIAVADEATGD